jgi:Cu(I)/Ag(I) efflux system protein CusF
MKRLALASIVLLISACNAAPEPAPPEATPAAATPTAEATPAPMPPPPGEAKQASATGVVQSVDEAAHSLVIAHGPVESLGWPGMTMTFQAPDVDLSAIKAGDAITFEFTSTGMDGTITSIAKQ